MAWGSCSEVLVRRPSDYGDAWTRSTKKWL
jgi:hypothetical protein